MKQKLISILLCLLLVLTLPLSVGAATLNTTDLTIDGNVVTIGADQDAVLAALHAQGRTAKITIPFVTNESVYVVKDYAEIVAHTIDGTAETIQFEVPGAGRYEIKAGTLDTVENQLKNDVNNVIVAGNTALAQSHSVASGTTVHANGNKLTAASETVILTAEGTMVIENLNGAPKMELGAGDSITLDTTGKATIQAAQNPAVGYGIVKLTTVDKDNVARTRTYFLLPGEKLTLATNGTLSGTTTFAPVAGDAATPAYSVGYEAHDNFHLKGDSGKVAATCNGLYAYYTTITISPKDSTSVVKLAEKVNGVDVVSASGIKVESGSTKLTLDSTYLNTIPAGTYTITFHYADGGRATGTLLVAETVSVADTTNPKTGDPIAAAFGMMCVSGMALIGVLGKKRR